MSFFFITDGVRITIFSYELGRGNMNNSDSLNLDAASIGDVTFAPTTISPVKVSPAGTVYGLSNDKVGSGKIGYGIGLELGSGLVLAKFHVLHMQLLMTPGACVRHSV